MSLFDRVLTEAKNGMTFKSQAGTDAFQHTDRYRSGRRNNSPATWFQGKNKRFPVWQQRASAAGTLRSAERWHGAAFARKIAKVVRANKSLKMCPSVLPDCPPKRNHGDGGKPEYLTTCRGKHCDATKGPADARSKYPWPFGQTGKAKWDKDWTALGFKKGSFKKNKPTGQQEEIELRRRPLLALQAG